MTLTPAMFELLRLLDEQGILFSQRGYVEHCLVQWGEWFGRRSSLQQQGVIAKLNNNFYPVGVDELHVFALLVESGQVEL